MCVNGCSKTNARYELVIKTLPVTPLTYSIQFPADTNWYIACLYIFAAISAAFLDVKHVKNIKNKQKNMFIVSFLF